MARSSPGVRRIAAILNFMATHPGQAFAMTDLVRALKLSRATCHALLTGLVEVGYLYRASDKTYVLGPALGVIGRAVAQHSSPLQIAQPEMRKLADEYDVVCAAIFLDGHIVEIRERAASLSHVVRSIPLGTRLKLRVPLAATFLTWMPKDEAQTWIDTANPPPTTEQLDLQTKSIAFTQAYGFTLLLKNPTVETQQPVHEIFGGENMEFPVLPAVSLVADQSYGVASILAPVLDPTGRIALSLGLMGIDRTMSGNEIVQMGDILKAACGRISNYITAE
jgi:DNA-binding IclR family transcriptional regulator